MEEDVALNPSLALKKVPIKMKPGEYELHILVETSTQLKSPEMDSDIHALICCSAFGKKQYSTKKKGVGRETVNWGEHFYFNKEFTNVREALGAKLLITVYNYSLIRSNAEIGSWEMDIYKIYENQGHCLNHEWIGLSSAVNDFKEVKGYLKISVSLTGENDKTIPLRAQKIETLTIDKKILLPPSIILRSYEITIKIFAARDIKPCDGQAADAYISAEFWNIRQKTLAVRRTTQPTFNKIIYLPVWLPAKTDSLTIRLVDHNDFISDQILGSFYPTVNDIFNRRYAQPKWINFYGPQIEAYGKQYKQHTLYPELATYYTGTVLMAISIQETDGPRRGVEPLQQEYAPPKMVMYRLNLDIHCGVNLFQKNKMHKILVKFGVHQIDTYYTRARNGYSGWFVRKSIVLRAFANSEIPNLFVYVVNEDRKKTSYLRFTVNVNQKLIAQFMPLIPDLAIKTMPPEEAGLLKFGFELNLAPKFQNPTEFIINSPLNIIEGAKVPYGKLVCNLFNAIELAPSDTEGTSDPFVVISYYDQSERSSLKTQTLNASYYENIVLNTALFQEAESPPIVISVYDQDAVSRELIGCFNLSISSAILGKCLGIAGNEVIPIWVPIYSSGMQTGKLLLSFQMYFPASIPISIPKIIVIPLKKFVIEGFVMSIDDLQMWGIINFHKPYLEFDYKNISPQDTIQVKNYVSPVGQILEKGVQIKQVHKAVVMLPQSTAYWTQLGVRLKDQLVGSVYEPLIGYFSINLAQAYKRSRLFNKFLRKQIQNNKLPMVKEYNNLKYSTVSVQRLKSLHKNIIICFSRFIIQGLNYSWNFLTPNIQLNHLTSQREFNPSMVVVFPSYKESVTKLFTQNYKEIVDSNPEYVVVGYDRTNQKSTKNVERRNRHYRFALGEPLKDFYKAYYNAEVGISNNIEIHTGRKLTGDDIVTNIMKMLVMGDTYRGLFKGEFLVQQHKEIGEMTPIEREIEDLRISRIRRRIMGCRVYVFLYVIDCHNLPSKDTFSPSDSYLRVSIGSQSQDNSYHFVPDDSNPKFYQKFKFLVNLPLESILTIEVWDQDDIDMDDLIGYIKIDVENRFWQNQNQITTCNPIETWQLKCDTSKLSQGDIRFWLDLVPFQMIELYKEFDITPKPKKKFQVRVIVWGCDDIPPNNFQKMSDFYTVCEFNGESQRTDTHWRSVTGDANFNWRMIYDVELPIKDPMLSFKVYDKDILSADDYKASTSFSIGSYLQDAFENQIGGYLYLGDVDLSKSSEVSFGGSKLIGGKTMYNRFLVDMLSPYKNEQQENTLLEKKPTVDISIEILTEREAIAKPAGKGREHPNTNPTLPQPSGRFDFGFNPFNLASKLCGKKYRYKAVCYCLIFILILTLYFLIIAMLGGIIANAIN